MSNVSAAVREYDKDGKRLSGTSLSMPGYLDWMPIELKAFWFLSLGNGDPRTATVLFFSQGEERLITVPTDRPLHHLSYTEYKEAQHGLEDRCSQFAVEQGLRRTPRNQ